MNLPASPDQLEQPFTHGNLPNYPTPSREFSHFDQQTLYQIHVALVVEIEQKAQQWASPLHVFLFNLYSIDHGSGPYINQEYLRLYERALAYIEALWRTGSDTSNFAQVVVATEAVDLLNRYQSLWGWVQRVPGLDQTIRQWSAEHQRLSRWVDSVLNAGYAQGGVGPQQPVWNQSPNPHAPVGPPGGGGPMPTPSQMSRGGGTPPPPPPHQGPGVTTANREMIGGMQTVVQGGGRHSNLPVNDSMGSARSNTAQKPTPQQREVPMNSNFNTQLSDELKKAGGGYPPAFDAGTNPTQQVEQEESDPKHKLNFLPFLRPVHRENQALVCWYDKADRPWYAIIDNADKSYWREKFKESTDPSMRYEDHETSIEALELARPQKYSPKKKSLPRWVDLNEPNAVSAGEEPGKDEEGNPLIGEHDPVQLINPIDALSAEQAQVEAWRQLGQSGLDSEDRIVEYIAKIMTPIHASKDEYSWIASFSSQGTNIGLDSFIDQLRDLASSEMLSSKLFYMLINRLTVRFNERLNANTPQGQKVSIDSILDDYDGGIEGLSLYLSESGVERFKENTLTHLIQSIKVRHDSTTRTTYFIEPCSYTHLPWRSDQMNLIMADGFQMLNQKVGKEIVGALQSLYERTSQTKRSVNRRYIYTLDGVVLDLQHTDIGTGGNIVIRRVDSEM